MAKNTDKLSRLRKKLGAKKKQQARLSEKVLKDKANEKALKDEIGELEREISAEEMRQLSETLACKGIKVSDIEDAIAAGLFDDKAAAEQLTESLTNGAANSAEENKEVNGTNEACDSGKTVGSADNS